MVKDTQPASESVKFTDEYRIDLIRKLRNDLIKDFSMNAILLPTLPSNTTRKNLTTGESNSLKKSLKNY